MIRAGDESDIEDILAMCEKFWAETMYEESFEKDHALKMVRLALSQELLAVLDINGVCGFVAGVLGPLLGNSKTIMGTEVAWWVEPEQRSKSNGINLMLFIEDLAKKQGVKYWNMISMQSCQPDIANSIYDRLNYKLNEMSWTKVI